MTNIVDEWHHVTVNGMLVIDAVNDLDELTRTANGRRGKLFEHPIDSSRLCVKSVHRSEKMILPVTPTMERTATVVATEPANNHAARRSGARRTSAFGR